MPGHSSKQSQHSGRAIEKRASGLSGYRRVCVCVLTQLYGNRRPSRRRRRRATVNTEKTPQKRAVQTKQKKGEGEREGMERCAIKQNRKPEAERCTHTHIHIQGQQAARAKEIHVHKVNAQQSWCPFFAFSVPGFFSISSVCGGGWVGVFEHQQIVHRRIEITE